MISYQVWFVFVFDFVFVLDVFRAYLFAFFISGFIFVFGQGLCLVGGCFGEEKHAEGKHLPPRDHRDRRTYGRDQQSHPFAAPTCAPMVRNVSR